MTTLDECKIENDELKELSGEYIGDVLTTVFKEEVHVIHPDSLSIHSLFAPQPEIQNEAIFDLLQYLHDLRKLDYPLGPSNQSDELRKPVIVVLNTSGRDASDDNVDPTEIKGSHWMSLVLLPKNFRGLLFQKQGTTNKSLSSILEQPEKIFLFDSIPSHKRLPDRLTSALIKGDSRMRNIVGGVSD